MANDFYSPTAICNEALGAASVDFFLGDISEGTKAAQVCLRKYTPCVQQMLRTAGWNFARKQSRLLLLADATGQTPDVGTVVPGNWVYSYALPQDCARLRYIPWNPFVHPGTPSGNIEPPDPTVPLTTATDQSPLAGMRIVPARFLVTSDQNYIPAGTSNDSPGVSPIGRTVVLCNVKEAQAIYTFNATWPNLFDSQFRGALVAFLAAEIALPLATDKRFGMAMRAQNMAIAQEKIKNARVSDGLEGFHTSDLSVDWMNFRRAGGGFGYGFGWMGNVGDWSCAFDNIGSGTSNSSAY